MIATLVGLTNIDQVMRVDDVSTVVRSGVLMLVGTLSMLCYIGYFTAEHFANTLGWPIALVIIGIAFIGISAMAVRLNNKYIKSNN